MIHIHVYIYMNMVTAPLGTPNVCTYKVLCIYICKSVKTSELLLSQTNLPGAKLGKRWLNLRSSTSTLNQTGLLKLLNYDIYIYIQHNSAVKEFQLRTTSSKMVKTIVDPDAIYHFGSIYMILYYIILYFSFLFYSITLYLYDTILFCITVYLYTFTG